MISKILNKKSGEYSENGILKPDQSELEYGELAINYHDGGESIFFKTDNNEIIDFVSKEILESVLQDKIADTIGEINSKYSPLTIETVSSGTIVINTTSTGKYEYKVNNGNWKEGTSAKTINVSYGDKIRLRGNKETFKGVSFSSSTAKFKASGNIASLTDKTNYDNVYNLPSAYSSVTFQNTFAGCTGLIDAEKLILPFTSLTQNMYNGMFSGCTSLLTAPELPATCLNNSCYQGMFLNCTSLTTSPELPATSLSNSCYKNMFQGCTSLIVSPGLPALVLADSCYKNMFANCTSLITAQVQLPAKTGVTSCYQGMFSGCTSLVYVPEMKLTTFGNSQSACQAMFKNCTSLLTAPSLSALTLVNSCYANMFQGCSSMTRLACYATNISDTSSTVNWLEGVAEKGKFISADSMKDVWPKDTPNGIPTGWYSTFDSMPLTIEIMSVDEDYNSDEQICLAEYFLGGISNIKYSMNDGPWVEPDYSEGRFYFDVKRGDKISFKADGWNGSTSGSTNMFETNGSITCNVYGNILSLFDSENYEDSRTYTPPSETGDYENPFGMGQIFEDTNIVDASNLILPTSWPSYMGYGTEWDAYGMFDSMFAGCTLLTSAPLLEGTALTSYCYGKMFENCESLTTPPELPATTLADYCYYAMFKGCTNLTSAPELPATTLTEYCYNSMFSWCESLTIAPDLLATTPIGGCYYYMFQGCTNLEYIKCMLSYIQADDHGTDYPATQYWTESVGSNQGTFVRNANMSEEWSEGDDGIPYGWDVEYANE